MGGGEAQTQGAFDPLLRQVFQEAEKNLEVAQAALDSAAALGDPVAIQSAQDAVTEARQAMLGGRAPAVGQNIDIIEAATRSTNNFQQVVNRRNAFKGKSTFYAIGDQRPGLTNLDKFVTRNGAQVNPETAATDPNSNQAAVSDLTQALDVILQLNRMLNTPPLTLLVNPETLTINYTKKQQYQDRNRFNYIFQSWGEEQVRLSVTGRSAGFVVGSGPVNGFNTLVSPVGPEKELVPSRTTNVSGYQYASKIDSAAWQNLMSLFQFYRNNGYIYDTAGRPRSEAHLFIGTIEITYDQWVYVGNFENFRYSYTETKQQGAIEFSFDFVASAVFDRGCDRTGVAPVRPYMNPPTPSPSMAEGGNAPVMSEPAPRTARELEPSQAADPSTAILDPAIDPFNQLFIREPTLAETLGPNFQGTILNPTGGT
jgi:hypothetical protein